FSTTRVSVVSSREAMEAAFSRAERVTLTGSMPPASGKQLEEKVAALEPDWAAYQAQRLRATVRVRFDNGFILDDADEDLFTGA
ncbi:hypothetical protein ABZY31_28770, partial [Streptomyces sp. NPDC006529]